MIYLVFSFKKSVTYQELNLLDALSKIKKFLPEAYKNSEMKVWQASNKKFLVASWQNININCDKKQSYACDSVRKHPLKGAIISSGHARNGVIHSSSKGVFPYIFELMDITSTSFKLSDTPGGSGTYSWISPDEKRSVSWNTQPPAFPLFIGKNHSDFCVVGNRALLVMLASNLTDKLTNLNTSYIHSYIPVGYSLTGETMFENVWMLPANKSVTCQDGCWRLADYVLDQPDVIPQELPLEEKSALLASALIKSFDVLHDFNSSVLWLSGGKDSRTLASVMANQGLKTQAVSFGSAEFDYAKPVAEICNADYQVHAMRVITDPISAAMKSNMLTEGLGISAAHQYNFQYPAILPEAPNVHGHGHLLRGGFARTMNADPVKISAMLNNSFFSSFVSDRSKQGISKDINKWEKGRVFSDPRDKLYWANHDLRLGAYTAPQVMDMTGKFFILFPLLDENVARIASGLFMFDKVSERVLFGAIKQLFPALSELPLYDEGWRFDRSPKKTDFLDSDHNFQKGFEKRHAKPLATVNKKKQYFIREGNGAGQESLKIRHQFIVESPHYSAIKELLVPEALSLIELRASGKDEGSKLNMNDNDWFTLNALLNRVFIATTLYDTSWL